MRVASPSSSPVIQASMPLVAAGAPTSNLYNFNVVEDEMRTIHDDKQYALNEIQDGGNDTADDLKLAQEAEAQWRNYQKRTAALVHDIYEKQGIITAADYFEQRIVQQYADKTFIETVATATANVATASVTLTYAQVNAVANQIAHWALASGIVPQTTVSIVLFVQYYVASKANCDYINVFITI